MSLVYGRDAEVAKWVYDRVADLVHEGFGPCAAIGVSSGDDLIAGVVYHQYQPRFGTIELSMAASNPMWARRENIKGLLAYPFRQLGAFKCWISTIHTNEHALKTWRHIGFRREAILAHQYGRKRHAVIMRMLQSDFARLYEGDE